jgi:hypothetical protein
VLAGKLALGCMVTGSSAKTTENLLSITLRPWHLEHLPSRHRAAARAPGL